MTTFAPVSSVVVQFFTALEHRDKAVIASIWHPDGVVAAAFDANGETASNAMRSAPQKKYLSAFFDNYDQIAFRDIEVSEARDGCTVWVQTLGELRVAMSGTLYCNRYVFKFTFDGILIKRLDEFANTVTQNLHGSSAVAKRLAIAKASA
jgi:ketosteroid isomerase-like protein